MTGSIVNKADSVEVELEFGLGWFSPFGSVLVKDLWTPLKNEHIKYSLLEQLFGDPPNG